MRIRWLVGLGTGGLFAACSAGGTGPGLPTGSGAGQGTGAGFSIDTTATLSGVGAGASVGEDKVVDKGCTSNCTDFPSAPIIDSADKGVPANAANLFGNPDPAPTGLCIVEPQLGSGNSPGALVPANWVRMRFRVQPAKQENLFEIRISSPTQANTLVAYTSSTTWVIPKDIWEAMGVKGDAVDVPITVTIRGVNTASPGTPTGGSGTFTIAPVTAGGSMVYWATNSPEIMLNSSKLVGFHVGDETVVDALTIPEVQQTPILDESGNQRGEQAGVNGSPPIPAGRVRCIGCHTSTPDGTAVGFTDHWPWNNVISSVDADAGAGVVPSWFSKGAQVLLSQPWLGMMSFSRGHWTDGDRIAITSYAQRSGGVNGIGFDGNWPYKDKNSDGTQKYKDQLAWFSVDTSTTISFTPGHQSELNNGVSAAQGTGWGILTLDGETRNAVTPSFSHDGSKIAYTSASATQDGRIGDNAETDIYVVPYGDRKGGKVSPVNGAATPGVSEYYPSFSADDQLIAYNRAGSTTGKVYYRPDGEVYVIPAEGGTPTKLAANDPPACTGEKSPGLINSWPKWSPTVVSDPSTGKTYYWLIFSSARKFEGQVSLTPNQYSPSDTRTSQLYMTGIVKDSSGNLTTYPAVYIWNQGRHPDGSVDAKTTNLTPAWDQFTIPPSPPPL